MRGDKTLLERYERAFMATYRAPTVSLVRGAGCRVWDSDGKEYLDFVAGLAVSVLGHAHPAIAQGISHQVRKISHTSNLFANPQAVELAEQLVDLFTTDSRVFFCNSGAEANETALKLLRRYHAGERHTVVAARGSFHGRTLGALSITGQSEKRIAFEPLMAGVKFVDFGDLHALSQAVDSQTAAVFLEPVLGEGGVIPAPSGYLATARDLCDRFGAVLIFDEVQGGIGRAGAWFSHAVVEPGVVPDVITVAKGLGGGLPIGACIARGTVAQAFRPGDHGATFGGNPLCCAAALAVLNTIRRDQLLVRAEARGHQLSTAIDALKHPLVDHVRGLGLWRAIVLRRPVATDAADLAQQRGLLVNAVAPDVLRLVPPLIITTDEISHAVKVLADTFDAVDLSQNEAMITMRSTRCLP